MTLTATYASWSSCWSSGISQSIFRKTRGQTGCSLGLRRWATVLCPLRGRGRRMTAKRARQVSSRLCRVLNFQEKWVGGLRHVPRLAPWGYHLMPATRAAGIKHGAPASVRSRAESGDRIPTEPGGRRPGTARGFAAYFVSEKNGWASCNPRLAPWGYHLLPATRAAQKPASIWGTRHRVNARRNLIAASPRT